MELRQLRYLVACAEEPSISEAAARLRISKATLSQQVAVLERELGRKLLLRNPRGISLTPAGSALVEHARRVLTECDRLQEAVAAAESGERPLDVRVANGVEHVLEAELRALQGTPDLIVNLTITSGVDAEDAVASGRADAAVGWIVTGTHSTLHVTPLATSPVWLAVSTEHRLATLDVIPVEELERETLALFPRRLGPAIWDLYATSLLPSGAEPGQILEEVTSLQPMMGMLVAAAEGRAVAPFVKVVASAVAPPGLTLRPLDPPLHLPIYVICREPHRPEMRQFLRVLQEAGPAGA